MEPRSASKRKRSAKGAPETRPSSHAGPATRADGNAAPEPAGAPAPVPIEGGGLATYAQLTPRPMEWLVQGLIPRGQLCLCVGSTGAGKSTFFTRVAAQVTGGPMIAEGDPAPPGTVIIYSAEEDAEGEALMRLRQARADLRRVVCGDQLPNGRAAPRPWLPDRITHLAERVAACRASVVIIDPLTSYLAPGISTRDGQHVRSVLIPLVDLCRATGVTILYTLHYRKSRAGDTLDWVAGSAEWANVPRWVLALGRDPRREGHSVIAVAKSSQCRRPPSRSYQIVDRGGAGYFALGDESPTSAQDLGLEAEGELERDARAEATEYLRRALDLERQQVTELIRRARESGISERTLRRAKRDLGVTAQLTTLDGGVHWYWCRPEKWPK